LYIQHKNISKHKIKHTKSILLKIDFLYTDVTILVWNADTNTALTGSTVTIGGISNTAPIVRNFARGTSLNMLCSKSSYTLENRTIVVQDTSTVGAATQQFTFLLSANLVRKFNLTETVKLNQ
jgi:hypothetical protein